MPEMSPSSLRFSLVMVVMLMVSSLMRDPASWSSPSAFLRALSAYAKKQKVCQFVAVLWGQYLGQVFRDEIFPIIADPYP